MSTRQYGLRTALHVRHGTGSYGRGGGRRDAGSFFSGVYMHANGTTHRAASRREEGQLCHDQRTPSRSSCSAKPMAAAREGQGSFSAPYTGFCTRPSLASTEKMLRKESDQIPYYRAQRCSLLRPRRDSKQCSKMATYINNDKIVIP